MNKTSPQQMPTCSHKLVDQAFSGSGIPKDVLSGSLVVILECDVEAYKVRSERKLSGWRH